MKMEQGTNAKQYKTKTILQGIKRYEGSIGTKNINFGKHR